MEKEYRPDFGGLGLPPPLDAPDAAAALYIAAAVDWLLDNTSFRFAREEEVPAGVKLFIVKYCELAGRTQGVQSESIAGMSQSFEDKDMAAAIQELAVACLAPWYRTAGFVQFTGRWGG